MTKQGWLRVALAGPGAIIVALTVMAGMTAWVPAGSAGINHLVLPLILVPLIWAVLFFHACLDRSLLRVALVGVGLLALHGGLIAHALSVRGAAAKVVSG